jgi:hypothetical protein
MACFPIGEFLIEDYVGRWRRRWRWRRLNRLKMEPNARLRRKGHVNGMSLSALPFVEQSADHGLTDR